MFLFLSFESAPVNWSIRNLPIHVKVALAPALALLGLVVVAAMAWFGNRHLALELERVSGDALQRVLQAQSLGSDTTRVHQRIYQSLTWEAVGQRAESIAELDKSLNGEIQALNAQVAAAVAASESPEDRENKQALADAVGAYAKIAVDTLDIKTAGVATAASYVVTLDQHFAGIQQRVAAYVAERKAEAEAEVAAAKAAAQRQNLASATIALLLLGGCTVLSVWVARLITRPLVDAAAVASRLAEGDLTVRQHDVAADATGRVQASRAQQGLHPAVRPGLFGEQLFIGRDGRLTVARDLAKIGGGQQLFVTLGLAIVFRQLAHESAHSALDLGISQGGLEHFRGESLVVGFATLENALDAARQTLAKSGHRSNLSAFKGSHQGGHLNILGGGPVIAQGLGHPACQSASLETAKP